MQLLLITGPAGVGKSTLGWEMSAQLAAAQVAHAVIETDELDRVTGAGWRRGRDSNPR
jgi:adenylylsulfate kinase-like enzyme